VTLLAPPREQPPSVPVSAPVSRPESAGTVLRYVVATASIAAAAIHFAVVSEHWDEWRLAGLFFGVLAWVQVIWAVAVLQTRSRLVLVLGILGQLGVVVLWVVSRTSGLPFGPQAGQPETAGRIDEICCVVELVAAAGAALLLVHRVSAARLRRPVALAGAGILIVAMAGATTASLIPSVGGGHEHAAAGSELPAGHTHGAAVQGDVPAGWITGCHIHAGDSASQLGHAPGTCTNAPVTAEQRAAAERLVADTTSSVTREYPTLQAAEKGGYRVINQTGPLVHVGNPNYQADGRVLDPERVESLVYVSFNNVSMLIGAMYIAEPSAPHGPLVGGALTSWHIHTNLCVDPTRETALNPQGNGACPPGSAVNPTAEMLHVWTIPYDGGPFAEIDVAALTKAVTGEFQRRALAGQPS
jgi:hypothetical protein